MKNNKAFIPYKGVTYSKEEMIKRSKEFYEYMDKRRSLRMFSDREIPIEVIENIIKTASSAPSGAHKQPWTFCVVSNPAIKKEIRKAAEAEEYLSYNGRMTKEWLADLAVFNTDWHKEFLETVPYLIVVFKKSYDLINAQKHKNYYVNESVGLATGFLIAAIHQAGLVTLTHTPSPMIFLQKILKRPENEKPFLLLPIGFPTDGAEVPDLKRKPLEEIMVLFE